MCSLRFKTASLDLWPTSFTIAIVVPRRRASTSANVNSEKGEITLITEDEGEASKGSARNLLDGALDVLMTAVGGYR
jgi:hypothetical protein